MRTIIYLLLLMLLTIRCTSSKNFKSIHCIYDTTASLRPGGSISFGIIAENKKGKKISTKGFLKGKYKFEKYAVTVKGGSFSNGIVHIDSNNVNTVNRTIKVKVNSIKNQSLTDSFELFLTYQGTFSWNFNGEKGKNGGEIWLERAAPRLFSTSILDGKAGKDVEKGEDGKEVMIQIYKIHDSLFYERNGCDVYAIKAKVNNSGVEKFTFMAEKNSLLIIRTNGGDGGRGGTGGSGIDGRDANSIRSAGKGTSGGKGGDGGQGGSGGIVKLVIDTSAKEILKYIEIQNQPGNGGLAGIGGDGGRGGRNADGSFNSNGSKGNVGLNGSLGDKSPEPEIIYDYVRF